MPRPTAILAAVQAGIGWTITTPLCLPETGLKSGAVQILPVPEGEFQRELTLIAHQDELGRLPRQLADDIIAVLHSRYLPIIDAHAPWLLSSIRLGDERWPHHGSLHKFFSYHPLSSAIYVAADFPAGLVLGDVLRTVPIDPARSSP